MIVGVPFAFVFLRIFSSCSLQVPASHTTMAISIHSSTERLFCTLARPKSPTSSMPAVSMKTTGPMGDNSKAFSTGSVVVPATLLTMEMFWLANALISDDFPALRLPNKPKCSLNPFGVSIRLVAMMSFLQNKKGIRLIIADPFCSDEYQNDTFVQITFRGSYE